MRRPVIRGDGVPRCSGDDCPAYDGKRCNELGYRPGSICEPEVADMAARLAGREPGDAVRCPACSTYLRISVRRSP